MTFGIDWVSGVICSEDVCVPFDRYESGLRIVLRASEPGEVVALNRSRVRAVTAEASLAHDVLGCV